MNEQQKQRLAEIKERENEYCSAPGCGYPDGKPCIKCGRIMAVEAALKKRFDIPFLLTLLDQAQRDTERVEKVMTLKQLADLKEILVIGQQSHRRELKEFGTLDQIIENITPYDAAIYTVDQALDQAALARGETQSVRDPRDFLDWTKETPSEQGDYWWWNEDVDSLPILVSVKRSGTDGSCFAATGQHGWNRIQPVKEMGGYWMVSEEPPLPTLARGERTKI